MDERQAHEERRTRETQVSVSLALDGSGEASVATGIGFFDHMLESLARHAHFDLVVRASGDLRVDSHHTVEDVAAVLGAALSSALGERLGIERFGHSVVPMDESQAAAAVDCSGRGLGVIRISLTGPGVGGIPGSLLAHFFEVLARTGQITLHLTAAGADDHHVAEAAFKATARALREAVRRDPALLGRAPSTKGIL